jgi:hypothetical protein
MAYLQQEGTSTVAGLQTVQHTVMTAGQFSIETKATENPISNLIVTINYNGSPIATSSSTPLTQPFAELVARQQCIVGDILTVVMSSTAPIDNNLNTVKTTVNIRRGI